MKKRKKKNIACKDKEYVSQEQNLVKLIKRQIYIIYNPNIKQTNK